MRDRSNAFDERYNKHVFVCFGRVFGKTLAPRRCSLASDSAPALGRIATIADGLFQFIDRFDPDELQDGFDKTLERKPLFDALNKLKYWQLYCDLYPIITQQGTASLPQQFSEDFVREYERSIAEFKRVERSLRDTQKLNASPDNGAGPSNDSVGADDDLQDEPTELELERVDAEAQA